MNNEDFMHEHGPLPVAVRMKRLTDRMMHRGRILYRELSVDIEPNWYLLFLLLKKYRELSKTEIAAKLHFPHP